MHLEKSETALNHTNLAFSSSEMGFIYLLSSTNNAVKMGRRCDNMEKRVYIQVKNEGFLLDMKSIVFHEKKGLLRLITRADQFPTYSF